MMTFQLISYNSISRRPSLQRDNYINHAMNVAYCTASTFFLLSFYKYGSLFMAGSSGASADPIQHYLQHDFCKQFASVGKAWSVVWRIVVCNLWRVRNIKVFQGAVVDLERYQT
ncbi:hypothetical protein JHK82_012622 [Glycine max]|uniref:Uncharacterized protein n=1 Tax=Glycine soja TaxID=3848 RepID=A0A0B2SM83_GLYSO|nr:hypothetical protein JHK87_012533 [Glycine soja]KAG5040499.1 hypothetical protein JHK85_012975 [Glycine max]KAG5057645.1 hypothetical protein JHK86_012641 [Glycine max]KAG5154653.1 hypothetical protein JHK82_012622 [Glycine max]KHN45963.1 hypothetical protein glysoja_030700 [Glycine soja]